MVKHLRGFFQMLDGIHIMNGLKGDVVQGVMRDNDQTGRSLNLRFLIQRLEQTMALDPAHHQRVELVMNHFPGALVVLQHGTAK